MSPLFLYPALSGRGEKQVDKPIMVFRNGERIKMSQEPNTSRDNFFSNFCNPCYRIPAMVITNSGRIVVASDYRSRPRDQVAICPCVAYSDDNGKTWKKSIMGNPPFTSSPQAATRCMDSTMFIDHVGKIHNILGFWNGTKNNGNWTQAHPDDTWSVVEFISSDEGETWTLNSNLKGRVRGMPSGKSWLGGVGNCVVTKQGTIIVPIQLSKAQGKVSMSFIYSNDGQNWTKYPQDVDGLSETSVSAWINTSGNTELLFISRKDPNTGNKKAAHYVTQSPNGSFSANFAAYGVYNDKIPAPGASGCQGSQIAPSTPTGNLSPRINVMFSYAKNHWGGYYRDHIVVGGFPYTNASDNASRRVKELEMINVNEGAEEEGIPYGGYSIMYYNHEAKKMGIVFENMLGIGYKDISYLIPQFLMEPAK